MKAKKFAVKVKKRYWRRDSPASANRMKVGLERSTPRVNLSVDS